MLCPFWRTFSHCIVFWPEDVCLRVQVAYRGYWDCVRSMMVKEGPTAFYRGLGVNVIKTVPALPFSLLHMIC